MKLNTTCYLIHNQIRISILLIFVFEWFFYGCTRESYSRGGHEISVLKEEKIIDGFNLHIQILDIETLQLVQGFVWFKGNSKSIETDTNGNLRLKINKLKTTFTVRVAYYIEDCLSVKVDSQYMTHVKIYLLYNNNGILY